jgi:hypothetical protein
MGWREVNMIRIVAFKVGGQLAGAPSSDWAQPWLRSNAPISPPPAKKFEEPSDSIGARRLSCG